MSSSLTNHVFQDYDPPGGVYEEYWDSTGRIRSHSKSFVEFVDRLGRGEFARRWEQAQRLVHENGFAYAGHSGPAEKLRPWELDAIPLLISSGEWSRVSAALEQRARVLNLLIRDLYGEQTLVTNGVLPPELVFFHPGLLQSYHGLQPPEDCYLDFYAADLARSPNGDWWILNDRTEAPSGLGYALENRVVISRMLPEVFQQCHVHRLAQFFIAAQERLRSLAPRQRENPRVVLLSPGPNSPNFFEDAYLARYLGFTLVEGGDLAVRNSHVALKTLGGLLPVDVIMRRQNSNNCDPLELEATSKTGVAGLTQAVRAGNVGIANSLGSGVVESVAYMAYMPALCRALLGEELMLPGVATWWCGNRQGLSHVVSNLDDLVVYPAFRHRGKDGPTRHAFSRMPREKLIRAIRANPHAFAAQEQVDRSSLPNWNNGLQPSRLAVRAYAVANGDGYSFMNGALARTSSTAVPLETSLSKGEGSKDVWVLSDGPVKHVTLLKHPGEDISLQRSTTELPSRVADNLLWLGRQLERADSSARLLRSTASRLVGETRSTSDLELPVLLRCLADQGQIEQGYAVAEMRGPLQPIDQVLAASVFDRSQPGSLRSIVDKLFRMASIVRDRLSDDTWRIIRRIDEVFQPADRSTPDLAELTEMTSELIIQLAAISGMIMESMTRTQAFRFLELGRRMERSLQIISIVGNALVPLPDVADPVFETVLEVSDSLMTYRSRYRANLNLAAVLDLLLTDESSARSLAYQFVQLADHIQQLPRDHRRPGYTVEQRQAMSLLHSIRMLDIQAVAEAHRLGAHQMLGQLLEDWGTRLPQLSEAISNRYLVHAGHAHQLGDIKPQ